jgi:TonB-linked SusC/RagA family outer membrane protein
MKHLNHVKSLVTLIVLISSFGALSQTGIVRGTVKDESGEPIYSATVQVSGQSKGTTTDDQGNYELKQLNGGTTKLLVRAVGFKEQIREFSIKDGESLIQDFVMSPVTKDMDEVVVIGYGTMRSKDLTGAATVVNEKNFTQGSMSTPEQLIMGKTAGLKINSNDGSPGSGSTIRLRGGTSINASNDPLIVVDGVPLDNGGVAGAANPLSLINPNDIASFTILKDASATAIYGSRAANGVILITTKKGSGADQKLKVNLSTKNSMSTVAKYADVLDGDQFRKLVTENGTAAQASLLGSSNTDWQREVFRNAFITDNNVSVTGGIKNLPYRLSFGNRLENGLLRNDQMNRSNVSFNATPRFFDNALETELNARFVKSYNSFGNRGALGAAYFDPTQSVYSGNNAFGGYYEWLDSNEPNTLAPKNPVGLLSQKEDRSDVSRLIGNIKLSYKIPGVRGLKAVVNGGTDLSEGTGFTKELATSASGYYSQGSYSVYRQSKGNKLIEAYLNYSNMEFKKKHFLDLTAGYSYQDWHTESPNNPVYNQLEDSIISPAAPFPFFTENAILSFYGRAVYSFDDRYIVNVSLRRDGSSRFSPETRWGLFPAVSAAYVLSEEKFMKKLSWISMLKVRGGFGITGQQDGIGDYPYVSNYYEGASTAQYAFGGQYYTVFRPGGFDANLKWERCQPVLTSRTRF